MGVYHHLNVQAIVGADLEGILSSFYAHPCSGIVSLSHGIRLAVATL